MFFAQPYKQPSSAPGADLPVAPTAKSIRVPSANDGANAAVQSRMRMYTSIATWCAACKASLPQFRSLRDAFTTAELDMSGVPVDPIDGVEKLMTYAAKYQPTYRLRTDLTSEEVSAFSAMLVQATGLDALLSTLITDTEGRLLLTMVGVPTVSRLRKLLRSQRREVNDR